MKKNLISEIYEKKIFEKNCKKIVYSFGFSNFAENFRKRFFPVENTVKA